MLDQVGMQIRAIQARYAHFVETLFRHIKEFSILDKFDLKALHQIFPRSIHWATKQIREYQFGTPVRDQVLNALVFTCGTLVALGGFLSIQNYSATQAHRDFDRPAKEVTSVLVEAINRHVAVIESSADFFADAGKVNRWAFFDFARKTVSATPGISALEWIPRVQAKQRRAYERQAVKDGLYDFRFVEMGDDGKSQTAGQRSEYLPVYFVEPHVGNDNVLGFDLARDPAAVALRRAADAGGLHAARMDRAPDGTPVNGAFAVIVPIYRSEAPLFTAAERRAKLAGFVRGIVRFDRILETLRPGLSGPPGLEFAIFEQEGQKEDPPLYHQQPQGGSPISAALTRKSARQGLSISAKYEVAGWPLTIIVRPVPSFFTRNLLGAAWAFLVFAVLMTALFLLYLISFQARTRLVERSVAVRTESLRTEITERRRIEGELRAAKDEAEMANRAKSQFLAMMSHELRTPLNAVIGFSEAMSQELFGPLGTVKYQEYSDHIQHSATHLLCLINDILDLSKIEADRFDLDEEEVTISDFWAGVCPMLPQEIATNDLHLVSNLASSATRIRVDVRVLRQILINLLSNAVKFTPPGGSISVTAKVDGDGRFVLCVKDNGIGIHEEDLRLVLEPFSQVDGSLARKYEGTGLGLPLSQRLAKMHGGTLEIESEPGVGTTVTLTFEADRVVHPATSTSDTDGQFTVAEPGVAELKEAAG